MAVSAGASKMLIVALGGASTVGVGGLVVHQGYLTDRSLDELAFEDGRTYLEWKVEETITTVGSNEEVMRK